MAIQSDKNLYPGINPHFNSRLQRRHGSWRTFHNRHIIYLTNAIQPLLPEWYYIADEESLQIRTYDAGTDMPLEKPGLTIPDVTVYRAGGASDQPELNPVETPTLSLPLANILDEPEEYITSTVIYRMESADDTIGIPVTRIELLSPANKPSGSDYHQYVSKRTDTLYSGLRLVEIDYLHERRPIMGAIPSYPDRHPDAYPYSIIISDPRPTFLEGRMNVYGFGVLDPLPSVTIPLDGADTVKVDFGAVYNQAFASLKLFYRVLTDYSQEPERFQSYAPADQERIRQHMAAIAAQHQPAD